MIKQMTNICTKMFIKTNISLSNSLLKNYQHTNVLNYSFATQKDKKVNPLTQKFTQTGVMTKQDQIMSNGRSWMANELRIKSNQDLHKLWYVCVKQKNILLADKVVSLRNNYKFNSQYRINKLKKTMARILSVISQRAIIRKQYREKLQQEYIQKKRTQLQKNVQAQPQPLPQITWELLRTKYQQLRRGIDNIDYIEKIFERRQNWVERQKRGNQRAQKTTQNNEKFKSFWQKQMTLEERPTQEQILRSHVSNWKQLNLKQRKIILGFLNAKRSKDAKKQLVKQLKIMGQKLAHQQIKQRTN